MKIISGLIAGALALMSHGEVMAEGEANFARTTLIARYSELAPSVTFWRDVMGFEYSGDPQPRTGSAHEQLGWDEGATTYFASFKSAGGSTIAILVVDDQDGYPVADLTPSGAAYGGVVLVHTATGLDKIHERAIEHGVDIVKPYSPSPTGLSMTVFLRAPTGQLLEIYEMIPRD